ncbi:retroelement [Artemisia annua]|uniref:Retroelement n=1 Tax=Artemisia annua TaxID=35608 RepID=A0A2U1P196_ARTAN|nr:retroelement [Artemisia annua]
MACTHTKVNGSLEQTKAVFSCLNVKQRVMNETTNKSMEGQPRAQMDDVIVKNINTEDLLLNIQEAFNQFRAAKMKLNPKRCSSSIKEWQCLKYLFIKQGMEYDLLKAEASPRLPKILKGCGKALTLSWIPRDFIGENAPEFLKKQSVIHVSCNHCKENSCDTINRKRKNTKDGSIFGLMAISPEDKKNTHVPRLKLEITSNIVDYKVLPMDIRSAKGVVSRSFEDRQLAVNQCLGITVESFESFETYMEHGRGSQKEKTCSLYKSATITFTGVTK